MYEDSYDLKGPERRQVQNVLDRIEMEGGLYEVDQRGQPIVDQAGQRIPMHFELLIGRRFCVDAQGRVWPFTPTGGPKTQSATGGGAPRRNDAIEFWTGNWRKVTVDGEKTYAKQLIWCPVSPGVNQRREGANPFDWYLGHKKFKHPHDAPHRPNTAQIRAMEQQEEVMSGAILAKMDQLAEDAGMDPAALKEPAPAPDPKPKRTNKRRTKAGATQ